MNDQNPKTDISDPDVEFLDREGIKLLDPLDRHHMRVRWFVLIVAVAIIISVGIFEVVILSLLVDLKEIGNLVVLLGITPIVSVTIIVAFILIGAFKSPGDAEIKLPKAEILQYIKSFKSEEY